VDSTTLIVDPLYELQEVNGEVVSRRMVSDCDIDPHLKITKGGHAVRTCVPGGVPSPKEPKESPLDEAVLVTLYLACQVCDSTQDLPIITLYL